MKNTLLFIFIFFALKGFSQTEAIDKLFNNLKETSSNTDKIDTLLKISEFFYDYNYFDKALENLKKSDSIHAITPYPLGKAKTAYHRALVFKKRRNYKKAENELNSALSIAEEENNDLLKSTILTELGGIHIKMKDYDTAADYLVDAIQLLREQNNPSGLVTALNYFSDLNLKYDRVKTVAAQLEEARRIGANANSEKELLQNFLLMRKLEDKLGNQEAAKKWMNSYKKLKNSLSAPVIISDSKNNLSDTNPYVIEDYSISDSIESKRVSAEVMGDLPQKNGNNKKEKDFNLKEKDSEKLEKLQLFTYILFALIAGLIVTLFILYKKAITPNTKLSQKDLQKIDELTERNMHLEQEIDVKNRLFSIISHDLKDALTSTKGFIDLIKDDAITDEEFKTLIPEVSNNADNASLLILNLLNWSKSQMKALDAKGGMFDIKEVITEKIKLLEGRINQKNITIKDNITPDFAYADVNMIEIVVQNLLANAIKFSNPGDDIILKNEIRNGMCIFSVADTGVGISKENQEKLFSEVNFTTIGTENEKGNGLGLSICKEMVDLNGGSIWVESELEKGTTFFVALPKSKTI